MSKRLKVAHDIKDFDQGQQVILTLKDHNLIKGQDLNDDLDQLQNITMREKGQTQFNRYLKDNLQKLSHASTSHIQAKMQGQGNRLLPHYDQHKYTKDGFEIEQDERDSFRTPKVISETIRQQKESESLMMRQNQLASEYQEGAGEKRRRVIKPRKVDKRKATTELMRFLEENAEAEGEEQERERTKRAAEYLIDELDVVKKKRNFDKAIETAMIKNKETQERLKAMEEYELEMALRKKKKAVTAQPVAKLLQDTYANTPDPNVNNTVQMDLDPLKVVQPSSAPKVQKSSELKIKDARGGMTSVLNVFLPTQRLFNKDKAEEELPEKFEDIPEEELEKMKEELAFMHEDNVGVGLSGALKFIREKGLLNKEEYEGRSRDEVPKLQQGEDRIKLQYRDAKGKLMTPKQAFRYMCWIFHGQGPGKNKIQKRKMRQLINQKIKTIQPGESMMMRMLKQHQNKTEQAHMVFKHQK